MQQLKDEGIRLGLSLLAFAAILYIAFYKESPLVIARVSLSLFLLFAMPGYLSLHPWHKQLGTAERLIAGSLLAAAFFIVVAYYLGLVGFDVKYATFVVPLMLYLFSAIIYAQKHTPRDI